MPPTHFVNISKHPIIFTRKKSLVLLQPFKPPALGVKRWSGKCQGCKRTSTAALPLPLRTCPCAGAATPGSEPPWQRGRGWEVTPCVSSREKVAAAPSRDPTAAKNPGQKSGVRERGASPSLPGIPGGSGGDRECSPPGLFAGAKVLRPADRDRWSEGALGKNKQQPEEDRI